MKLNINSGRDSNIRGIYEGGQVVSYNTFPQYSSPIGQTDPLSTPGGQWTGTPDAKPIVDPTPSTDWLNIKKREQLKLKRLGNQDVNAHALALILNIYHYDQKPGKPNVSREGSELDVTRCKETLEMFGCGIFLPDAPYDTRILHKSIGNLIEEFKGYFQKSTKACIVIVMGHGDSPGELGDSSHEYLEIQKIIFNPFNNENFKVMLGKPKLFFMNCCRGVEPARLVKAKLCQDSESGGEIDLDYGEQKNVYPLVSDILIFWSTTPSNPSVRYIQQGAVFIQMLFSKLAGYLAHLQRTKEKWEIRDILQHVAIEMYPEIHQVDNVCQSQTPNLDLRTFNKFYLLDNDCEYVKYTKCPF